MRFWIEFKFGNFPRWNVPALPFALGLLARLIQAQRWSAEGYAGQSWRYGVPPEFWPGATVGSSNLDWEPRISLRDCYAARSMAGQLEPASPDHSVLPGKLITLCAARLARADCVAQLQRVTFGA